MRALIADDDRVTTLILAKTLRQWNLSVEVVNDGNAAWKVLCEPVSPALAIIDWMMPGLDGLELCRRIRSDARLSSMHVILLTGRTSSADTVAGLDAGADDYMRKPFEVEELRARVHVGVRMIRLQERLAAQVTALQVARDELEHLASTDPLTALCSRRSWFTKSASELARLCRYSRRLALLMLDLDHFKQANDQFGHAVGDLVLKRFADLLSTVCRGTDIVARIGGEEFAILLPETSTALASGVAQRIVDECRAINLPVPSGAVRFTCSIGVTEVMPPDTTIDDAMRRADAALYRAKRAGRDRVVVDMPVGVADQAIVNATSFEIHMGGYHSTPAATVDAARPAPGRQKLMTARIERWRTGS